ncbi:hypothetical protein BDW75DRAFT_225343 [Aspergillus navahoensis]
MYSSCAHPLELTEHIILGFVSGSKLPVILNAVFNRRQYRNSTREGPSAGSNRTSIRADPDGGSRYTFLMYACEIRDISRGRSEVDTLPMGTVSLRVSS